MAMASHLGLGLSLHAHAHAHAHAQTSKLASLEAPPHTHRCALHRSAPAVPFVSLGVAVPAGTRRLVGVRAAKDGSSIIRAAKKGSPPIMPAVLTPSGPVDLGTLMLRNRIIFVGSPVNSEVAQSVISKLLTLAAINDEEEIKMYINCPGGSTYSIMAIYDAMQWGTADDVRRQVDEVMSSRDKIDKMYSAFCDQPLERVRKFTERDYFFSAAEALDFGLIDGLLETEF
ncbi:hypothetical protein KC19_5G001500 [Ceratodon purpureus]|uniref:ATP-dependent Clp protease proteolytic subunit n=1 Tax=Ceratodon purpureus TaxID=3225 RepID=A0A8T0HYG2_CERPU|nr:hypothetical protein KC19_5G001500 [Ceratodon purpureus]